MKRSTSPPAHGCSVSVQAVKKLSHPHDESAAMPNGLPMADRPHTELVVGDPGPPHSRMVKPSVMRSRWSTNTPSSTAGGCAGRFGRGGGVVQCGSVRRRAGR